MRRTMKVWPTWPAIAVTVIVALWMVGAWNDSQAGMYDAPTLYEACVEAIYGPITPDEDGPTFPQCSWILEPDIEAKLEALRQRGSALP